MPVVCFTSCDGNLVDLKPNFRQPQGRERSCVTKSYSHFPHGICIYLRQRSTKSWMRKRKAAISEAIPPTIPEMPAKLSL